MEIEISVRDTLNRIKSGNKEIKLAPIDPLMSMFNIKKMDEKHRIPAVSDSIKKFYTTYVAPIMNDLESCEDFINDPKNSAKRDTAEKALSHFLPLLSKLSETRS